MSRSTNHPELEAGPSEPRDLFVPTTIFTRTPLNDIIKSKKINLDTIRLGVKKTSWADPKPDNEKYIFNTADKSAGLPQEMWEKIISNLDIKSIIHLSQSCKTFYNIIFSSKKRIKGLANEKLMSKVRSNKVMPLTEILPKQPQPTLQMSLQLHSLFQPEVYQKPEKNIKSQHVEQPGINGFIMKKP